MGSDFWGGIVSNISTPRRKDFDFESENLFIHTAYTFSSVFNWL